ncbi:MAG: alpha/beta hydrolase [Burkholderiaceae bacterium]|nr:alpha/beta hydrolase [Burkholderiaceae bacterium]
MTNSLPHPAPLDPVLASIGQRWRDAQIPDIYEGCLEPHGGPVSRERARNVRGFFYPKPDLPKGLIEKRTIDGRAYGVEYNIPVQIIWPHNTPSLKKPLNTLVYFHGGGFVVGDLDSHEAHAVRLANESECIVVNVDYRLAPEHRFPAAYDDCLAVTRWAHQNIDQLGRQHKRFAIGGDSAGGNLAAAVAISCRDLGIQLAAQLLMYPATDLLRLKGMPEKAYLGEENLDLLGLDPRASPKYASTHVGLAPTILGVGPHDFLYADNMAYASILRDAQVPLTLREFPTLNHGFFSYTSISADSLAAARLMCADLKSHFDLAGKA